MAKKDEKKMGRPKVKWKDKVKDLEKAFLTGASVKIACGYAQVSTSLYFMWKQKAESVDIDDTEHPDYHYFALNGHALFDAPADAHQFAGAIRDRHHDQTLPHRLPYITADTHVEQVQRTRGRSPTWRVNYNIGHDSDRIWQDY